jgi:hypothetical protein
LVGFPAEDFDDVSYSGAPASLMDHLARDFLGLEPRTTGLEVLKRGVFIFDSEDDFVEILAKNVEKINNNPVVERMVRDYLLQIVIYHLLATRQILDFLNIKEHELCALLGEPAPPLIQSRLGALAKILLRNTSQLAVYPTRDFEYFTIEGESLE